MTLKETVSVSYHSAPQSRTPPVHGVLENKWLHKLFLLTHVPASWSAWKIALGLLILTGLVGWGFNWNAAGIYLIFALSDWVLLWWLPHSGRSFGPIGPQLLVMTVPRLAVMGLAFLLSFLIGTENSLMLAILFQIIGLLAYLWGTLYEPFALQTTHQTVETAHLPANRSPIRLLHLSDLHMERLTRRETDLLAQIEQIVPDLIVITGDYLNLSYVSDPVARTEVRKILLKLKAPYGVYATLGSPPVDLRDTAPHFFEGTDIRLLRDEIANIELDDGQTLTLLGLDCEHDLTSDASAFQNLIDLAPADSVRILLYHSPELMPLVQKYPVELYLCGHTHGGQIRMPFYGAILTSSALGKRYEMGLYTEQGTSLYISRGIGLEGLSAPRMRLLCRPEIILFNLVGTGKEI